QQRILLHDLESRGLDVRLIRGRLQKKPRAVSNTHKFPERSVSLSRGLLKPRKRTNLRHKFPRQLRNLRKLRLASRQRSPYRIVQRMQSHPANLPLQPRASHPFLAPKFPTPVPFWTPPTRTQRHATLHGWICSALHGWIRPALNSAGTRMRASLRLNVPPACPPWRGPLARQLAVAAPSTCSQRCSMSCYGWHLISMRRLGGSSR